MSKYIVFSFDDGRRSQCEVAYKVLQKYGMKATINVVTEFVENSSEFDSIGTQSVSWNELQEMCTVGGWEIANHGATHKNTVEDIRNWFLHEEVVKNGWNKQCGFASPGSALTDENSGNVQKLMKNEDILYIRSGKQTRREGIVYVAFTLLNRLVHGKRIFRLLNRDCILTENKEIIKAIGITAYDTDNQVKYFLKKLKDNECVILMFHSILPSTDIKDAKDYWYWEKEKLESLCEFIRQDDSYKVVTTKEWWLRNNV